MSGIALLDSHRIRPHAARVAKRALPLLLLIAALVGLFGQDAARAIGPRWEPVAATADASMDECMEMMDDESQPPCDGLTLDCIAAMGCVVPATLADAPAFARPVRALSPPLRAERIRALIGRSTAPGTHPPTSLI